MARRTTNQIEIVETHNLATSINRIRFQSRGHDPRRWKRALYHAIAMTDALGFEDLKAIRLTLGLP